MHGFSIRPRDPPPPLSSVSVSLRASVGSIVVLGFAVAILLPNGHVCLETDALEVRRQWSYSQERWFYGCWPSQDVIERGIPFRPTGAHTDLRIPLRIGAVAASLLIAWIVVDKSRRRSSSDDEQEPAQSTTTVPTVVIVELSALGGAVIALLLTIREDPYCILFSRAPGGLSCTYRSFFGWNATPILVELLFTVVGAIGGMAVGLSAAHAARISEAARTGSPSSDPQLSS
jgi:hypothetical protein